MTHGKSQDDNVPRVLVPMKKTYITYSRRLECEWNMWRVQLFRCSMGVGRNWARRPRSILPSYLWYCVQRVLRMAQALGLVPSAEVQARHGWLAG